MPKLDHVAIRVTSLAASIAFYTEKLGLKLLFQQVDPGHGEAFAFLELEGGNLELLQLLDKPRGKGTEYRAGPAWNPPAVERPYCPHLALEATDLDLQVRRLKESGVPIVAGPLEIPGSVRWLYVHDPDHNIIEYIEHLQGG
jgi:catechol 2,3-dioxygenase-like lactoylglutathione lyase family enzyme